MYICIYAYMYICTYVYMYICTYAIHMYAHTNTNKYTHTPRQILFHTRYAGNMYSGRINLWVLNSAGWVCDPHICKLFASSLN